VCFSLQNREIRTLLRLRRVCELPPGMDTRAFQSGNWTKTGKPLTGLGGNFKAEWVAAIHRIGWEL